MAADDFDDRIARLQEHVVYEKLDADDYLDRAEQLVAEGKIQRASFYLSMAQVARVLEEADDEA